MSPYARRRAASGRLRGLAHLVLVDPDFQGPSGLSREALCGFRPKRFWSTHDAPGWEQDCPRCLRVAEVAEEPVLHDCGGAETCWC